MQHVGTVSIVLGALTAAVVAGNYACNVLEQKPCIMIGSDCYVGQKKGTVTIAALTWQCSPGAPGMSECGPNGTNTVACTYYCLVDKQPYQHQTRATEYALGGVTCQYP